jgi:hypothetical protein
MVRIVTVAALCGLLLVNGARAKAAESAGAKAKKARAAALAALDPALATLARFVGGTWVNVPENPANAMRIEIRYDWAMDGNAVRSTGVIGKGRPDATPIEATCGWDPARKQVYYVDFHGANTVFQGTMKAMDKTVQAEFETIVGQPGKIRSLTEFLDDDNVLLTIWGQKDGDWAEAHRIRLRRER